MIRAEIALGDEYKTVVAGETINEVLDKIKRAHTMDSFDSEYYTKKGTLNEELSTGWYYNAKSA